MNVSVADTLGFHGKRMFVFALNVNPLGGINQRIKKMKNKIAFNLIVGFMATFTTLFLFLTRGDTFTTTLPMDTLPKVFVKQDSEISDQIAVQCIVGEASNQGVPGMLVVASALRNRGTTQGVYGCKAAHIWDESSDIWDAAGLSWWLSAYHDFADGADSWQSITLGDDKKDFGWNAQVYIKTVKDHKFYRRIQEAKR